MAPRRKAQRRPEPGGFPGRCAECGKVAHPSRSKAKRAARNGHGHEYAAVNVYPCGPHWHVGHKRKASA